MLPPAFKKIQECVNRLLRNHNEEEKVERGKIQAIVKVLCNVQTKLANQKRHIKFDLATMIGDMKKEIHDMVGNSVPENSINNIISQLSGMSGEIESNFSNLFTKINKIGEDVNTVKALVRTSEIKFNNQ
jgi:hypothetical protein